MYVMVLLGLGLRELSVAPSAIPELKRICRSLTIEACEAVARRALELDTAAEVDACLRQELERLTLQPVQ
jgi:phosphotransferase system enzyme I (PtsI)